MLETPGSDAHSCSAEEEQEKEDEEEEDFLEASDTRSKSLEILYFQFYILQSI
jgi:hypothetical protein